MADRYWVGGSGTWASTGTTNWSATSGGAGGASNPTTADNVFFDNNSGTNYTVTLTTGTCGDFTIIKPTAGTVTFAGTANFTTTGNFTVGAGVTWTHTGNLVFGATTTGKTITTNGITFLGGFSFSGVAGGYTLADNLTSSAAAGVLSMAGNGITVDLNNKAITIALVNIGGASVKTINFGTSGAINVFGNNTTVWSNTFASGLIVVGTPIVNLTYAGSTGTRTIAQGTTGLATEANTPSFNITAGSDIVALTAQATNVNFTGFTGTLANGARTIYGNLILNSSMLHTAGAAVTTFGATSTGKTITTGNVLLPFPITFSGTANIVTWQVQDNFIVGNASTHTVTLTTGNVDFNNRSANIFLFVSNNALGRGISNIAGNTMNITGSNGTVLNLGTITNFSTPQLTYNFTANTATGATAGTTRTITVSNGFSEALAPIINIQGGADNVTVSTSMRDLDTTGFAGNLVAASRTLYGNLTIGNTTTVLAGATTTTFASTSGVKTINTNGQNYPQSVTLTGIGGTVRLLSNLITDVGLTSTLTVTNGNLDLNNYIANSSLFSSTGGLQRSLAFGSNSVINLSGSAATVWSAGVAGQFLYTGNARVNLTYAGPTGTRTINHGGTSGGSEATKAPPMYITAGTDIIATQATSHLADLVFQSNVALTNTARVLYGNLILTNGMNVVAGAATTTFSAGNLTQTFDSANISLLDFPIVVGNGTSNGNVLLANNTTLGTTRTTILTSGTLDLNGKTFTVGLWSSTGTGARRIYQNSGTFNVAGSGTTVWNMTNSTNFSYPTVPTVNFTYSGSTGTRTVSSVNTGGTANNSINFNFVSGADAVVISQARDLNFTGFTGNLTNTTAKTVYGNLTFGTGMLALGGTNGVTFAGVSGNQTITSNGVAIDFPLTITNPGANLVLSEALTTGSARALTVNSGNLYANGYNISCGQFSSSNGNPRNIDISGIDITLAGTGQVWNMFAPTGANLIANNSNIYLTSVSTALRSFEGGSLTYGNLDIGGATGTSTLTMSGNNTFAGTISSTKTVAHTIQITDGTTQTVGGWTVSGSAGALVTIKSASTAQHNLVLTGGGNVSTVDYLNISYSNASPATDTWYAGNNSIDGGNNFGWIFPSIGSSSNFFLVF